MKQWLAAIEMKWRSWRLSLKLAEAKANEEAGEKAYLNKISKRRRSEEIIGEMK